MKKYLLLIFCNTLSVFITAREVRNNDPKNIFFKENKGQVSDQFKMPRTDILFSGRNHDMVYHLKSNGISYQIYSSPNEIKNDSGTIPVNIYRLDISWLNCNKNVVPFPDKQLPGYETFYSGVCPSGVTNVRSFTELTYKNIYKGIDLYYYGENGDLKYDYIVAPFADYRQILLKVEGADKIYTDSNGNLIIETPLGIITEKAPIVTQATQILKASWHVEKNIVSFDVENVNSSLPLIIDPLVRNWGTYYGDANSDQVFGTTTDLNGNVYLTGRTNSPSLGNISTVGSHQFTYAGGAHDAFLAKFNTAGVRLWATFYGDSGDDVGRCCVADASGNIYLTGSTNSPSGAIASATCHQLVNGGGFDGYLVKFNSAGIRQWGTFYGGSGNNDQSFSCALDPLKNIYICGQTNSPSGTAIATPGSYQTTTGLDNAFLVKFDSMGVRQWGTFFGGITSNIERALGCATTTLGEVYMCGITNSSVNISSVGSHQSTFGGGIDSYITKFSSSGALIWSSYYGGSGADYARFLKVDNAGNILFGGNTTSQNNIATVGSHQASKLLTDNDAFLVKMDASGVRQWATYYGGIMTTDYAYAVTSDNLNNIYMCGQTNTNANGTIIATPGSYQPTFGGGFEDAFMVQFNSGGVRQWGTFYGGGGSDDAYGIARDAVGNLYLAGFTNSPSSAMVTPGCHQPFYGGSNNDGFLAQFSTSVPSSVNEIIYANQESVYPVPADNTITIQSIISLPAEIVIFDLDGKLLLRSSVLEKEKTLDLTLFSNGIYFIQIREADGQIVNKKIIVAH